MTRSTHKKLFVYIPLLLFVLFILLLLVVPDITNAAGNSDGTVKQVSTAMGNLTKSIALGILSVFAWLAGLAGLLLNYSIEYFVLGFGDLVVNQGLGSPIDQGWKIVRDVINLILIFSLLYVGIITIVDANRINARRLLVSIIISALLVNFSLFFSKAVIDVSNVLSDQVFKTITNGNPNAASTARGISGEFFARLGVQSFLTPTSANQQSAAIERELTAKGSVTYVLIYALGASIFFVKLMFAFGLGAVLLAIRFIVLIFLMTISPIAFASSAFPAFAQLSRRWWSALLGQAFLAPVYLFILYLTLLLLNGAPWSAGNGIKMTKLFDPDNAASGVQLLGYFLLAIIGLIAAGTVGKQMSSAGATGTMKVVDWMKRGATSSVKRGIGTGIGAGSATLAVAGRNTIGRGGQRISENESLKEAASRSGLRGWGARRALNLSRAAGKKTYDARSVSAVGAAAKAAGVKVGTATKKNYVKAQEEKEKKDATYAESLRIDPDRNDAIVNLKQRNAQINAQIQAEQARGTQANQARIQFLRNQETLNNNQIAAEQSRITTANVQRQARYADTVEHGLLGSGFTLTRSRAQNRSAARAVRVNANKERPNAQTKAIISALKGQPNTNSSQGNNP